MAFIPYNPGTGTDHSILRTVVIYNSITVAVGEAVALNTTGYVVNASAAAPIFGIVIGFAKPDGTPLNPSAYVAGTATGTDVQSVAAGGSNTTTTKYAAIVETSTAKVYSVNLNGTINTTGASGSIGCYIDVDSANTTYSRLLESTGTRTASTCTNFVTLGRPVDDSTRALVKIRASQLNGNVS